MKQTFHNFLFYPKQSIVIAKTSASTLCISILFLALLLFPALTKMNMSQTLIIASVLFVAAFRIWRMALIVTPHWIEIRNFWSTTYIELFEAHSHIETYEQHTNPVPTETKSANIFYIQEKTGNKLHSINTVPSFGQTAYHIKTKFDNAVLQQKKEIYPNL